MAGKRSACIKRFSFISNNALSYNTTYNSSRMCHNTNKKRENLCVKKIFCFYSSKYTKKPHNFFLKRGVFKSNIYTDFFYKKKKKKKV